MTRGQGLAPGVERMQGVDAGYLYMETPTMSMHTLKIAVLDPAQPFEFERFRRVLLERLERLPPMHRRVQPVPLALNHPLWVVDAELDPDRHLFHHKLPKPGMAALEDAIGRVASTPLDRSRPLWELHVFEGLAENRVAVVGKLHHALADGTAANALLGNITDAMDATAATTPLIATAAPGRTTQLRLALSDAVRQAVLLPALLVRTVRAVVALVRYRRQSAISVPRPVLDVPRVSFNGPLTAERVFATSTLPLEELRELRKAYDVSLNDVVLAVVSGALRRWMDAHGEQPRSSLVAGVPVATDPAGSPPRLRGNRVSNLFTSLATDVDDPVERLQRISATTAESKVVQRTLGPDMLVDWVEYAPPGPLSLALRWYSRSRAASRHPSPFNVIVSNVPGPKEAATISGTELVDLYSVGPILEGIGLNITVWSYVDRMNFSLLSCPALIGDLRSLAGELRPALDELRATLTTSKERP